MSNVATFNLLSFVESKPWLSAKKIMLIVILFAAILFGYGIFQSMHIENIKNHLAAEEAQLHASTQAMQSLVYPPSKGALIDITTLNLTEVRQDFYAQFLALSRLNIPGLWLKEVVIKRDPFFVQIKGSTNSTEKLNQLVQQLMEQPEFQHIQFQGVNVVPELFKDVPKEYQQELASFKLPTIYHFVIQTTLDQSAGKVQ